MIMTLPDILSESDVVKVVDKLNAMRFIDGTATAGWHAKLVKNNQQVDRTQLEYQPLNKSVTEAIMRNGTFRMAARPRHITPLLFSRYKDSMEYGTHVDDPVMYNLRSDISFTLFLADPNTYDGGELVMETSAGEQPFKLEAGHMIIYPSTTLHRVTPVTRGERTAAVGWCQSYVRNADQREILYDLDIARRGIFEKEKKSREFDVISRSHANLLRMWTDG
ncbi:MAG: Fe2+-dependent dioxygenase [Alphaproteobacteria bacterium]|nr:Fe2+-dependent dioxygenase [Alphaproteobacteria bacterium]